jgi:hypothetical protein
LCAATVLVGFDRCLVSASENKSGPIPALKWLKYRDLPEWEWRGANA